MEHTYLRALLEDTRSALEDLFEQGFAHGAVHSGELKKLAERLVGAGLTLGGELLGALEQELERSRFQARPVWDGAAKGYAALWQYLAACGDRLDYLEAAAALLD